MRHKKPSGQRDTRRRFLTQANLGEIRWAVGSMNSQARRAGKTPKLPKISMFSCKCNCFHVDVGQRDPHA